MKIVLLFLDGVGLGRKDPDTNPFFAASLPRWESLLGEMPHLGKKNLSTAKAVLVPANATLGVEGLPQSGTGQTAIFTGVNAPREIGRHFGPFPTTDLKPVIEERNVFRQLLNSGRSVFFANALLMRRDWKSKGAVLLAGFILPTVAAVYEFVSLYGHQ